MKHVGRMKARIHKLLDDQAVSLQEVDMSSIVADVSPVVNEKFSEDSPQRVFWEQQLKYNSLKDKRQMRWHPLAIRFALNLKYLSGSAYRALRHGGVIGLPSECTLSDYTHWTSPRSGVQLEFIEEFQRLLAEEKQSGQQHCALSMDEMKLKSGLVYHKHTVASLTWATSTVILSWQSVEMTRVMN